MKENDPRPSTRIPFEVYVASIASAYVRNNRLGAKELPDLIRSVHTSLANVIEQTEKLASPKPAVNPRRSVHRDYIVCLEDGKRFKSLKRHLAKLGLTPDAYRQKWGLPDNYPMVAPGYSETRSALAKVSGLGRRQLPLPLRRAARR